jgi:hypothetical protein
MDMIQKSLMNNALVGATATFTPTGVVVSDSSKGTLGAHCTFSPRYFKSYAVDQDHEILLNKAFYDGLSDLRFSGEDEVTVDVDFTAECFKVTSTKGLDWKPKLSKESGKKIPFQLRETPGVGILPLDPRTERQIHNQFATLVDNLSVPKVEKVSLHVSGGKLTLELDYDGPFVKPIPLESPKVRKIDTDDISTIFVEQLNNILANFKGDVFITTYDKVVFFTQITPDFSMMYYAATT